MRVLQSLDPLLVQHAREATTRVCPIAKRLGRAETEPAVRRVGARLAAAISRRQPDRGSGRLSLRHATNLVGLAFLPRIRDTDRLTRFRLVLSHLRDQPLPRVEGLPPVSPLLSWLVMLGAAVVHPNRF